MRWQRLHLPRRKFGDNCNKISGRSQTKMRGSVVDGVRGTCSSKGSSGKQVMASRREMLADERQISVVFNK